MSDGAGAAVLSVKGLSKRFGDRVAFEDVSFEVGSGEVFGFLGPNGAGKTTTVRTLSTLIAPTSGSAAVAGFELVPANGVEIRRRISVMPESPGLYLRLSVAENLRCFADLYEVPDAKGRIGQALQAVRLAGRADDTCGTLSKGLRQRVALAARCSVTRRSCSSMSRPPAWTRRLPGTSMSWSMACASAASRSSSQPTGWRKPSACVIVSPS
jgi:ABC-type multidrug transport system ATPase subunit